MPKRSASCLKVALVDELSSTVGHKLFGDTINAKNLFLQQVGEGKSVKTLVSTGNEVSHLGKGINEDSNGI